MTELTDLSGRVLPSLGGSVVEILDFNPALTLGRLLDLDLLLRQG